MASRYVKAMMNQSEIFDFKEVRTNDTPCVSESDAETSDSKQCEFTWVLRADCPYLDGHFPGQPVLPAVATIDGSIEAVKRMLKQDLDRIPGEVLKRTLHAADLQPRAVFNAKFMAPITPGLNITINLSCLAESKWQADWSTIDATGAKVLLARIALVLGQ